MDKATMAVVLYYHPLSPPSRAVLLTAKALNLSLTLKKVDVLAGEQLKPEFIAINPQHTIPTMVDGNLKLWESKMGYFTLMVVISYGSDVVLYSVTVLYGSDKLWYGSNADRIFSRAICTYLATQYGKNDSSTPATHERVYPVLRGGTTSPEKLDKLLEALGWLNTFLMDYAFTAGNKTTVADMCLVATVSTIVAAGVEIDKYTRVVKWLARCKSTMPGYAEANGEGANSFGEILKAKLQPQ
ncbi:Glutathione S-transferase 1-like 8 [Homarus americanus]|uniref:Glutathione S-transferase 1-like 8 n=1 Tax=Homarus americanus TaxID=6706 RepID=A0A8J5JGI3_HOMAM|nr:Glutathione S-transferase 1-like 8 [Homarus americanus]